MSDQAKLPSTTITIPIGKISQARAAVIYVKTQFEAFHRWIDAPEEVAFLRNWHRHVFHVKVSLCVQHNNRDIEFFMFRRLLDAFISRTFAGQNLEYSCETIAYLLASEFDAFSVEVSEDGENGAIVS